MSKESNSVALITYHGCRSMKSRLKTGKKDVLVHLNDVLCKAIPREETRGELRRFLDSKMLSVDNPNNKKISVWRNFLWIFSEDRVLITCFPIPGRLGSRAHRQTLHWHKKNGIL